MNLPILGDVIREIGSTVRQVLPDKQAQAELDLKIAELADKADARESDLLLGQIEVNKTEATSANLFVSGWRPAVGWIGAAALGWTWILAPLVNWIAALCGAHISPPALAASEIYPVILGMLGLGTMRTVEKMRGVATSLHGNVLQPTKSSDPYTNPQETQGTVTAPKTNIPSTISRWLK